GSPSWRCRGRSRCRTGSACWSRLSLEEEPVEVVWLVQVDQDAPLVVVDVEVAGQRHQPVVDRTAAGCLALCPPVLEAAPVALVGPGAQAGHVVHDATAASWGASQSAYLVRSSGVRRRVSMCSRPFRSACAWAAARQVSLSHTSQDKGSSTSPMRILVSTIRWAGPPQRPSHIAQLSGVIGRLPARA